MQLLIHLILFSIYLAIFLWLIKRWSFFRIKGVSKKLLAVFFLFKVAAGVSLTLVYTYYYPDPSKADIYRYFNDSKVISSILFENLGAWIRIISGVGIDEPGVFRYLIPTLYFSHPQTDPATSNRLIIRVISLLNYLSFYNIYINTLFFNFFSFLGITALFRELRKYFETFYELLYIPLYLMPSVIFWGSGMLKEQLIFTFLGVLLSLSLNPGSGKSYWRWIALAGLVYLIYCIKPFVALAILTAFIFLPVVNLSLRSKLVFFLSGALLLAISTSILTPLWTESACSRLIDKRNEFIALAIKENAGSFIKGEIYPADCLHLISAIPGALAQSVLGPFIWQEGNLLQALSAVENMVFLLLIVFLLFKYFKVPDKSKQQIALFFFIYSLFSYVIIGIAVPVTGAMVHYRIIASPFLLLGVLFLLDLRKVSPQA